MRLVIDTGVFIPCGDKSEDKIRSINHFGSRLPRIAEMIDVEILLSTEILKEYKMVPAKIRRYNNCHPLPEFHSSVIRIFNNLLRNLLRLRKCIPRKFVSYSFHVIESSKLERYEVEEFVDDREDVKFLKVALAAASRGEVYLVSVDNSLLKLRNDRGRFNSLCSRYQEARNIQICLPDEAVA